MRVLYGTAPDVPPEEELTITVGVDAGDFVGSTDRALQAAIDYLDGLGGGTLRILPGEYHLGNALYLRNNIAIEGSGEQTRLVKKPSVATPLAEDSDWYQRDILVEDGSAFSLGDGVIVRAKNPHGGGMNIAKRTLVGRTGNRFWLDHPLGTNFWADQDAQLISLFPLITGERLQNIAVRNLVLEGNRSANERLDGNYAGCIFLEDCRDVQFEGVTAQNYHGDGFSWQICHDVVVRNCRSINNSDLGFHPGSGSQRPVIENNYAEGNRIGIFVCWGVKHGVIEGNRVVASGDYGLSIGHRDTDNRIVNNEFEKSGKVGILFRNEPNEGRCPHRNIVERNRIVDSGRGSEGVGIDIQSETRDITLKGNELKETSGEEGRIGVRIGPAVGTVTLDQNTFSGYRQTVVDQREQVKKGVS